MNRGVGTEGPVKQRRRSHFEGIGGEVAINPTLNLALPAVRGSRERIAAPTEVGPLRDALDVDDRATYGTALYAGLKAGELQALHWHDIDITNNLIHISSNWDRQTGFVAPKSRAGNRRVPITATLRRERINQRLHQSTGGTGFVFPSQRDPTNHSTHAASPSTPTKPGRTLASPPAGLHECRHSYATYIIAAGINTKALSTYMGHASITITLDRYGHLLPGNETQAAHFLETWPTHATTTKQAHQA